MHCDSLTDLQFNERIVLTEARAKEVRSTAVKKFTCGKRGDYYARRQAAAYVRNEMSSVEEQEDSEL